MNDWRMVIHPLADDRLPGRVIPKMAGHEGNWRENRDAQERDGQKDRTCVSQYQRTGNLLMNCLVYKIHLPVELYYFL